MRFQVLLVFSVALAIASPAAAQERSTNNAKTASPPHVEMPPAPAKPAQAEPDDDTLRVASSADGKTLYLIGTIAPGSYRKFRRIAAANPKADTVFLGSPGGIVLEGFLIGTLVRERKMRAYVDVLCSSSCTQIFIAGAERVVAPLAKVGFHESWRIDKDGNAIGSQTDEKRQSVLMRASYLRSGIDEAFANKALSTPFSTMWYPSLAEMQAAKVVTRVSNGTEPRPPFALGPTRSEIEAALLQRQLWPVLKRKDPSLYDEAIDIAWRAGQTGTKGSLFVAVAQNEVARVMMPRVAVSSDATIEALLALIVGKLDEARQGDGERCETFGDERFDTENAPADAVLLQEETLLLAAIETPKPMDAMTEDKALKKLMPLLRKVYLKYQGGKDQDKASSECRYTFALFEELSTRPRKEQIMATRALLTLGNIGDTASSKQAIEQP